MTPDRETEYSRLLRDYWRHDGDLVNGAHIGRAEVSPSAVKMLAMQQERLDKAFNELCLEREFTHATRLEHACRLYATSVHFFGTPGSMVDRYRRRFKAARVGA